MLSTQVLLTLLLSTLAITQDVDNNDIPNACRSTCSNVVNVVRDCDRQWDDDNPQYLNCICTPQDMLTQIPMCEACVAANDDDGRDNDVNDLLRSCSLSTTFYNPSATPSPSTSRSGSFATTSTSSSGSMTMTQTPTVSGASRVQGATGTGTQSVLPESTGAAATMGLHVGAGVGLGLVGLVAGML